MSLEPGIKEALATHPCYNEEAHRKFARMHVPVAPKCNIQCNFCNRRFDCCNESRPGVTSEILAPEQAAEKIAYVKERVPNLSVIGIAGPGDPLANEETFRTLELVRERFPELTACVSTNGLTLPDCARRLHELGVRFVTVTKNALTPETGAEIYDSVVFGGRRLTGTEGAAMLLERQREGIRACAELGMAVKVNIVMIPGVNDSEIPDLVKEVKGLGAYMVNILPLIPVEGTRFAGLRAPTPKERRDMMDRCELDARMMRHCRQCRADAIGLLGEDRSPEFVHFGGCGSGCGPTEAPQSIRDETLIAVATADGRTVGGFGSASAFRIYATDGGTCRFLREVPVDLSSPVSGESHRRHLEDIVRNVSACGAVIVSEIGPMPSGMLSDAGVRVIRAEGDINEAVRSSAEGGPRCEGAAQSARSAGCLPRPSSLL